MGIESGIYVNKYINFRGNVGKGLPVNSLLVLYETIKIAFIQMRKLSVRDYLVTKQITANNMKCVDDSHLNMTNKSSVTRNLN